MFLEEMTKTGLIDLARRKTEECDHMKVRIGQLERMNEILERQIGRLINAKSVRRGGGVSRRDRARHESMDTISEVSPQ